MHPSSQLAIDLQQRLIAVGYDFHARVPEDSALPIFWWSFKGRPSTESKPVFLTFQACLDDVLDDFFSSTKELVKASQDVLLAYAQGRPLTAISKLNEVLLAITVKGHHTTQSKEATHVAEVLAG